MEQVGWPSDQRPAQTPDDLDRRIGITSLRVAFFVSGVTYRRMMASSKFRSVWARMVWVARAIGSKVGSGLASPYARSLVAESGLAVKRVCWSSRILVRMADSFSVGVRLVIRRKSQVGRSVGVGHSLRARWAMWRAAST